MIEVQQYEQPVVLSRAAAERVFAAGTAAEICDALASAVLNGMDWRWCQSTCLRFLNDCDVEVSGLAATCLGHLARIHHKIDRDLVVSELRKHRSNEKIGGRVQDALDDIAQFMPM